MSQVGVIAIANVLILIRYHGNCGTNADLSLGSLLNKLTLIFLDKFDLGEYVLSLPLLARIM